MDKSQRVVQFTHWINQRPNTIEFWEIIGTAEHLIWCFAGEAYRSMLLRADTATKQRERIKQSDTADLVGLHERNFQVPVASLNRIDYTEGTRFRRATLEIQSTDSKQRPEMSLVGTSENISHHEEIEQLQDHPAFSHVKLATGSKGIL